MRQMMHRFVQKLPANMVTHCGPVISGGNPGHHFEAAPPGFQKRGFGHHSMEHKRRYPADRHDLVPENNLELIGDMARKGIAEPGLRHIWQDIKSGIV